MKRRARVRALAKINLELRVIGARADGYHEIRTVLQTISLADTLEIAFTPGARSAVRVSSNVDIRDNLAAKAAEALGFRGVAEIELGKRIPLGSGLGGGSSDAAAVLLALPVLARKRLSLAELNRLAVSLGSDVPFFLIGGRAIGVGRGEEVYPLPEAPAKHGLVVASRHEISTARAYRELAPHLTSKGKENKIVSFGGGNDFERAAFRQFPRLGEYRRKLAKLGAEPAMMSGSGSAVFGLFRDAGTARRAKAFMEDAPGVREVFQVTL
ncbi:MAG: 4-(cytidine 5'-diphospho)-2-C-methyl-D-erythritol kinase, partial [Acidobacteria bacterium]|nr:4-(cytidine 5'-diphospho)-2-C-methyl-D-erythritol kinase [Acidobacteriota bacterium]